MSIVDQNTTLFDDTVLNNIKYARPDATNEEIFEASNLAMCKDFIDNLENGFETMIGENGVKLSGGEKQRLSIARALIKNPDILILDEATASLDSESEKKVHSAIDNIIKDRTVIIIAHRFSTIINADKILVMNDGKIVECGSHNELLKKSTIYKNLYELQMGTSN